MAIRYTVFLSAVLSAAAAAGETPAMDAPLELVIDHHINAALREAEIEPAPVASGTTLIRRLTLDLAGRIPAVLEIEQFLQSDASDKRSLLVDRLMHSEEFVDQMSDRFNWFITQGEGQVAEYLKTAFRDDYGWDRVFRDIVLADLRGEAAEDATEFLKHRVDDADRLTNDVSVTFFGVNISCAKCHDHFLAPDWTQGHYYGMKSFFSRTFKNGDFVAERDYGSVKFTTTGGEERQAQPMFLTSKIVELGEANLSDDERKEAERVFETCKKENEPPPPPQHSLREALVDVALDEGENHFFARAIVNRLWHQFFGTGLVMPLDQMHSDNPPTHPELLDRLAEDLVEHGYDLRRLVRGIVMSDAYARSSFWDGDRRPYPETFAVAMPRPLTPMQLARSLSLATADPKPFACLDGESVYARIAETAAPRNRETFEQPREDFQVSASESLWFTNSEQFSKDYLQGGLVNRLVEVAEPRAQIETAVWNILSRSATDEETELLQSYIEDRADRPEEACRQIVWALLASSEFRFNH